MIRVSHGWIRSVMDYGGSDARSGGSDGHLSRVFPSRGLYRESDEQKLEVGRRAWMKLQSWAHKAMRGVVRLKSPTMPCCHVQKTQWERNKVVWRESVPLGPCGGSNGGSREGDGAALERWLLGEVDHWGWSDRAHTNTHTRTRTPHTHTHRAESWSPVFWSPAPPSADHVCAEFPWSFTSSPCWSGRKEGPSPEHKQSRVTEM